MLVRLSRDDGEIMEIILQSDQLPAVVAQLQRRIAPGRVTPIRPHQIAAGATATARSTTFRRNPDGTLTLLHTFELLEERRVVQLPVTLTPEDARSMAATLADFLAGKS